MVPAPPAVVLLFPLAVTASSSLTAAFIPRRVQPYAPEREAALSYHQDPTRPVTHLDLDFLCTLGGGCTS
jgi:hypothetical protein